MESNGELIANKIIVCIQHGEFWRRVFSHDHAADRPESSNVLGLQLTEIAATEVAQIQLKIILKPSRKAQLIMRRGDMWR